MTGWRLFHLKNEMLVANFLANIIGVFGVNAMMKSGYTGDVINEMTEGLKERDRIRRSLSIAKEVQQHLLPQHAPDIEGLDIAGQSIYCGRLF